MYDIKSQRQKKKNSSILLKSTTKFCFLDDIDYLALCSKQNNNAIDMIKPSKTHISISPLRVNTRTPIKDRIYPNLNTSVHLSNSSYCNNNDTSYNPNQSIKLINFSQMILDQIKKEKAIHDMSFCHKPNYNVRNKQPISRLNVSSSNAKSSFDIKEGIVYPSNIISNRKLFNKNRKIDTFKSFTPNTKMSQSVLNPSRMNKNVIKLPTTNWIKKSYLNSHLKKNSVGNENKSRNFQGPVQFEWSKQAAINSMEKYVKKRKVDFSHNNRASNNLNNTSNNQTDDSSILKKKDLQVTFDSVKADGPEEIHLIFVALNQQKNKVYGNISNKLKLEKDGILEGYLEYE